MRFFLGILVLSLASCGGGRSTDRTSVQVAPSILELTCDGSTTGITQPAVQAQADGVHVEVRNGTHEPMVVGYAQGAGNAVDPGRSELVLTLTPGTGQLRCLHPKTMVDAGEWRSFDVLAPEGWVSPELDCSGTRETGIYDYVPGALGVTDPFADAQSRAPGAILEEAGYRAEGTHTILAVEDGIPTQLFFYDAVHGGTRWLLGKVQSCST